jgi:hypothetical protein
MRILNRNPVPILKRFKESSAAVRYAAGELLVDCYPCKGRGPLHLRVRGELAAL